MVEYQKSTKVSETVELNLKERNHYVVSSHSTYDML